MMEQMTNLDFCYGEEERNCVNYMQRNYYDR